MLLPDETSTHFGLAPEIVHSCFEDYASISTCLEVFRDLVSLIPKPVLCIVDGAEALEDRSDRGYTKDLANVFEALSQPIPSDVGMIPDFRLCVTTDGYLDHVAKLVQRGVFDSISYELESDERMANDMVEIDRTDLLGRDRSDYFRHRAGSWLS
jgi:hypothetical protein